MDDRELGIIICAYLKSSIESGAEPDAWKDMVKHALKVHGEVIREVRSTKKESKKNG